MRLHFLGAAHTVTGSQFLLQLQEDWYLIDCGMYQGSGHLRDQNRLDFHFDPTRLKGMLLTHAHIDHSGLIPRLCKQGFCGHIFTTGATTDLCGAMLLDSAHIQEEDAKFDFKKWQRSDRRTPPPMPLYTQKDAEKSLRGFVPVEYDKVVEIGPNIKVRWRDAGHILGAASLEVWATEGGQERKIVFSGDIGNLETPFLENPTSPDAADFVLIETTYGDRLHEPREQMSGRLAEILQRAYRTQGHVIIPTFAVGRTQEVLYAMRDLHDKGKLPKMPVFVDSPLATEATRITLEHPECYNTETRRVLSSGENPFTFPGLEFTESVQESMALNDRRGPMVILSAAGMCNAGRIRHHLRNHIGHGNDIVVFVGYQAYGTLGREIEEGAQYIELFGEKHKVRARIEILEGFSAHADQKGLLNWLDKVKGTKAVFCLHGEQTATHAFADLAREQLDRTVTVPDIYDAVDLLNDASMSEYIAFRAEQDEIQLRAARTTGEEALGDQE
jgi:metallo-beta-lactamase family protein